MYLFIFEDDVIKKGVNCSDDDLRACDNGILSIVDLHSENPKEYFGGEWHNIEKLSNEQS